jgi:hypothetical protein
VADKPLNSIADPHVELPHGYRYGVTRGADLILQGAHPKRFADLLDVLEHTTFKIADMVAGGGGRSKIVIAWDTGLQQHGWAKRNVTVKRVVDDEYVASARSHEIDMFGSNVAGNKPYPGIACEMEWANKDPFFDRDLATMAVLHMEGVIDLGIIVTRGPTLHKTIRRTIPGTWNTRRLRYELKYGETTTHWDKLTPKVERGGGGGCPLLLIGIEPECFDNCERLVEASRTAEALITAGDYSKINAFHKSIIEGAIS